jgi:sterol desaturase/sphingolipid hydroxylase (fatty acid hydroxylase superfamily)
MEKPGEISFTADKKKFLILVGILLIPILAILIYYYRVKLSLMFSDPEAFFDLFLTISQLKSFTLYSTITTFSLCAIAFLFDLFASGWHNSALRKIFVNPNHSTRIDIFCFFLAITRVFQTLQLCFSLGIAYFIASIIMHYLNFNIMGMVEIPILQPLIIFVLLDLKHYFEHRVMHTKKLWELHAYHHSATEFTLFTNARGHLLEESVYFIFTGLFFALMGSALHTMFIAYAFREMYGYLLHLDIKTDWGWVGRYILVSPQAHKLHHSVNKEDYGKNYGTLFVWWDKLFGTYKEPPADIKIGLQDDFYNEMNFFKGQWVGFKRWINTL